MSKYINKNGLSVGTTPRDLFEELMRGTGFVMGPNASLYIENIGLHEKNIVVSRVADSENPVETEKFSVDQFQKAVGCFNNWKDKPSIQS